MLLVRQPDVYNNKFVIDGFCANNDLKPRIKGTRVGVDIFLKLCELFNLYLRSTTPQETLFRFCTLDALPPADEWWGPVFGFRPSSGKCHWRERRDLCPMHLELAYFDKKQGPTISDSASIAAITSPSITIAAAESW